MDNNNDRKPVNSPDPGQAEKRSASDAVDPLSGHAGMAGRSGSSSAGPSHSSAEQASSMGDGRRGPSATSDYRRYAALLLDGFARYVVWIQGIYYMIMGLWPLLSITTFQSVTGPKTDLWLVKTVGILLIVSGAFLVFSAYRRRVRFETTVLAVGYALALILVEVVYVLIGTISPVYLLDSMVQILLIVGWFRREDSFLDHVR